MPCPDVGKKITFRFVLFLTMVVRTEIFITIVIIVRK